VLILVLKPVLFTVSLHLDILCLYRNQYNMNEWRKVFLKQYICCTTGTPVILAHLRMCCCSIDWVSALCHCPVKSKELFSCMFWCDGPTGSLHTARPTCLRDLRTVLQASVHSQNQTPSWGTPVLPRHTAVTYIRSSHLTAVHNPCIQMKW